MQGLAQHPITVVIYASEHGPTGGDELNILKMEPITMAGDYLWHRV
ncbi:PQQ-dependent sugar dehydrogenase [Rhodocytophaga rosea]|nr:PQQ-dependent sugar dehydrogenase [Rhodocytophaga rosea]